MIPRIEQNVIQLVTDWWGMSHHTANRKQTSGLLLLS